MATSIYSITLTNSLATVSPSDGFVDNTRTESYVTSLENPPADFVLALSQAKRRANVRYREMILQFARVGNIDIGLLSIVATGASYKTEPTAFTFTVLVEHGEASLVTDDELNVGQQLTGQAALKRLIARALTYTDTLEIEVFDPTPKTTIGNALLRPRFGLRILPLVVGAITASLTIAEGLVTITPIVQH